ncbi:MAG: hypothetical protein WAN59_00475 [Candidatus Baltobacteraceae bacterium]
MDDTNPQSEPAIRLKSLLKEAGLKSARLDSTRRGIAFPGRAREWLVVARLNQNWLHLYTFVCNIPEEPGLRARLLEETMHANAALTLVKFVAGPGLCLEIDYRAEHLDASVVGNLVSLLYHAAEEQYPKVFRIVSGDETLRELETSLEVSEAA